MEEFPLQKLKQWFALHARSFPFREKRTPYRVWVSEVMLQQTRASVVASYFEKWMALFPTLQELAAASIERVLKAWEGLGYYSRARNLHRGAQLVVEKFNGQLPADFILLSQIPGIGPYTCGAILSFGFGQKSVAIDANVTRVLARYLGEERDICQREVKQRFHNFVDELQPINEELIELGALVCQRRPLCSSCPLREECLGFRHGQAADLPRKKKRAQTLFLQRTVAVIVCQDHFLLWKGEKRKVMEDLYEFPFLEGKEISLPSFEQILGIPLQYVRDLPCHQHSFTRYRVELYPHLLETNMWGENNMWKKREEIATLPFSSGHRRVLQEVL
ncbi:MAG: A/G-specific adenine glycosylase [Chlamydiales bacterium]